MCFHGNVSQMCAKVIFKKVFKSLSNHDYVGTPAA